MTPEIWGEPLAFLKPTPPPYDPVKWDQERWPSKIRMACQGWALQGYGTPVAIYLIYAFKVLVYIALWCFFCSFTEGLGDPRELRSWCFQDIAFQKAVLWSMAFEGLGLGCASGPLTARYWPPVGGFLYFLRPGTTKMPIFPGIPIFGGSKRSILDVALYGAYYVFLFRALLAPELNFELLLPIIVLLPLIGLGDKTIVLAARAEHYYVTLVCFCFANDWIAGAMAVQLAIWIWAATSKLTPHFPSVIGVMTSNSPVTRFAAIRKLMYRRYPDDLRPSRIAHAAAHFGTIIEFSFPLTLAFASGGWPTTVGLVVMLAFHGFITSNIPMGVPIEWNVHVVYGAFFLFGHHSAISVASLSSPALIAFLFIMLILIPLIGNFFPARVSFLFAMRYYAGNWPFSVWLFSKKQHSYEKLDQHLIKSAPSVEKQLSHFYDEPTALGLLGKVPAFRAMHLQGRILHSLLPRAVEDQSQYTYVDGELVAGVVIGWNFGDGHLHNEQLLEAVQGQCKFQEGELRCIFVESSPLLGSTMAWRIVDAASGEFARGKTLVKDLQERQPWPT
jgi:hypothetical protein